MELIFIYKSFTPSSAGSTFWHPGMFEVRKTQDVPEEEVEDPNCSLSVRVSSDLEGFSRVRVEIVDPKEVCGKKSTKSKREFYIYLTSTS